jgi:hypothetical protein
VPLRRFERQRRARRDAEQRRRAAHGLNEGEDVLHLAFVVVQRVFGRRRVTEPAAALPEGTCLDFSKIEPGIRVFLKFIV